MVGGEQLESSRYPGEGCFLAISPQQDMYSAFEIMQDEEVVDIARAGSVLAQEYLINKYRSFVRAKARSYFLIGADREDIIQEGMIGLFIRLLGTSRSDKLASFQSLRGTVHHAADNHSNQDGY